MGFVIKLKVGGRELDGIRLVGRLKTRMLILILMIKRIFSYSSI